MPKGVYVRKKKSSLILPEGKAPLMAAKKSPRGEDHEARADRLEKELEMVKSERDFWLKRCTKLRNLLDCVLDDSL